MGLFFAGLPVDNISALWAKRDYQLALNQILGDENATKVGGSEEVRFRGGGDIQSSRRPVLLTTMKPLMYVLQLLISDMRVDLGGTNILMTK